MANFLQLFWTLCDLTPKLFIMKTIKPKLKLERLEPGNVNM